MDVTKRIGIPLLLFFTTQIAAHVPLATNVTLLCHNFQNILYWNYSRPSLHPKFRIDISALSGSYKPLWVESPTTHADVSFLNDQNNDYRLGITAVVGQNESEATPPLIFSYFIGSLSPLQCSVDIPPINVSVLPDNIIKFSFIHPWHFYHKILAERGIKPKKAWKTLEYTAEAKGQDYLPHNFLCEETTCSGVLTVDSGQKNYCVAISGQWENLAIKTNQEYCTPVIGPDEITDIRIIIVVFVVSFVAIGSIVLCIIKKTRGSSPIPESMRFPGIQDPRLQTAETTTFSQVEALPIGVTPLLTPQENNKDISLIEEKSMSPSPKDPQDNGEVCVYMHGNDLDEDSEESSGRIDGTTGYEQREILMTLDTAAPKEVVKGYRG